MPKEVAAYVDKAIDDPNIKTGPLCEEVPWLFAMEERKALHPDLTPEEMP
jgi:hypothetical protein